MEDNGKFIEGIYKYCTKNSLLVIGKGGMITRINCPFRVQVTTSITGYPVGCILYVESVDISEDLKLLYLIHQVAYPYYKFIILL